jgi:hypothetical protein
MLRRIAKSKGQVTVEVAVLFSAVVAALVLMGIYLQRAAQGGVKSNADSLGTQFSSQTGWSTSSISNSWSHDTRNQIESNQLSNSTFNQDVN